MLKRTSRVTTLAFLVLFLVGLGVILFPGAEPNHSDSDRPDPAVKGSVETDPETAPDLEIRSTSDSIESTYRGGRENPPEYTAMMALRNELTTDTWIEFNELMDDDKIIDR